MKDIYTLEQDFEPLAKEVIAEHSDLKQLKENNIRIGYITSTKRKKTRNGIVFADTRKVIEPYTIFCPYDFLITFYVPHTAMLNNEQFKILMWHELKHCGVDNKGDLYVVPHDIEDFSEILEKHGLDWANTENYETD